MPVATKEAAAKVEAIIAYLRRKKGLSKADAIAAALLSGDLVRNDSGELSSAKGKKRKI